MLLLQSDSSLAALPALGKLYRSIRKPIQYTGARGVGSETVVGVGSEASGGDCGLT